MAHKAASIWNTSTLPNGWRYGKPVMKANHKIDPRRVLVKGKVEDYPSGQFYLHIVGQWCPIGKDPVQAN